ncbi:hypothetical protein CEXT_58501 [Caerostris extrusa]|uniref:Uncharacterized protein n=1 Tax=Caerostris extrusa TaxID=172846 RepID=A0AAV4U058_CAEEX|nr:hypothetical protein CEXT_58501 [Caerostris extrusa]
MEEIIDQDAMTLLLTSHGTVANEGFVFIDTVLKWMERQLECDYPQIFPIMLHECDYVQVFTIILLECDYLQEFTIILLECDYPSFTIILLECDYLQEFTIIL